MDKLVDLERAKIPRSLHNMVQILLEEEDRLCSNNPTPLPGPCLDYFFREGILAFLCNMCVQDRPPGMRKLTMTAVSNLLRSAHYIPLLPHQSVQVPLSKLVRDCLQQKVDQEAEKHRGQFQFDEEYLALLETISLKIAEIPSCIHFFIHEEEDGEKLTFPIFDCLILHIHQNDTRGERSRQATERLLAVATNHRDERLMDYILTTDFPSRVVQCTIDCYVSICQAYAERSEITTTHLNCLVFCSNIISVSPEPIANQILSSLQTHLFLERLIPDFRQTELLPIVQSSAFIQYFFRYVHSTMMRALLWKLLLNNESQPEKKGDSDSHPLRGLLMQRINSPDDSVAVATLGIIGGIIEIYDEEALHSLFLRNLPIRPLLLHQLMQSHQRTTEWLHNLLPSGTVDEAEFHAYLHDAQLGVYQAFLMTEEWKFEFRESCEASTYEGELLERLFMRLEQFTSNSELVNIALSEILLKMIRLPHPAVQPFFLNPVQEYPGSMNTLSKSLSVVSQHLRKACTEVEGFLPKFIAIQQQMKQPAHMSKYFSSSTVLTDEEKQLLSHVVVFESFCQELVAHSHAKATQAILASSSS